MPLWWVLSTVLIAMAYYLFGLVIKPRMLLSARVVKSVRSEEDLILRLIIGAAVWTAATGLTVATPSHNHGGLTGGDARTELLTSILLLIGGTNLVVSISS
jgi:hypothetical protein